MVGILHKKLILPSPNPLGQSASASCHLWYLLLCVRRLRLSADQDKTEKLKEFLRKVLFSRAVISIGYSLTIFFMGRQQFNWQQILSNSAVN